MEIEVVEMPQRKPIVVVLGELEVCATVCTVVLALCSVT